MIGGADEKEGAERAEEARLNEYWLGLGLSELPEIVKEQLGLKQGLVVDAVVPDSPAAKADLREHDILTKAGDQPLSEPVDLLKVVADAKDKELALTVVRGGKERVVKVTPAKRPQETARREGARFFERAIGPGQGREEVERLEKLLGELRSKAGNEPVRGWFAHPGVIVGDFLKRAEFPKNLTVRITKEGDQPVKIYVKRDDQEWEVTADKLSELPEDIRMHVQPMLGGGVGPFRMALAASPPGAVPPGVPRVQSYRVEVGPGVEGKLDAILKKLDRLESESVEKLQSDVKQLRKEVDELRDKK